MIVDKIKLFKYCAAFLLCSAIVDSKVKAKKAPIIKAKIGAKQPYSNFAGKYFSLGTGLYASHCHVTPAPLKNMGIGYAPIRNAGIGRINFMAPRLGIGFTSGFENIAVGLNFSGAYNLKAFGDNSVTINTLFRQGTPQSTHPADTLMLNVRPWLNARAIFQFGPCIDRTWLHANFGAGIDWHKYSLTILGGSDGSKTLTGQAQLPNKKDDVIKLTSTKTTADSTSTTTGKKGSNCVKDYTPYLVAGIGVNIAATDKMYIGFDINYCHGFGNHKIGLKYTGEDAIAKAVTKNDQIILAQQISKYRNLEVMFNVVFKF